MAWDDDFADEEWVDDEEEDESSDDLLLCPSCRGTVHEDTQQCPHCGDWINPIHPGGSARRWLWAVVVVLLIAAFVGLTRL